MRRPIYQSLLALDPGRLQSGDGSTDLQVSLLVILQEQLETQFITVGVLKASLQARSGVDDALFMDHAFPGLFIV